MNTLYAQLIRTFNTGMSYKNDKLIQAAVRRTVQAYVAFNRTGEVRMTDNAVWVSNDETSLIEVTNMIEAIVKQAGVVTAKCMVSEREAKKHMQFSNNTFIHFSSDAETLLAPVSNSERKTAKEMTNLFKVILSSRYGINSVALDAHEQALAASNRKAGAVGDTIENPVSLWTGTASLDKVKAAITADFTGSSVAATIRFEDLSSDVIEINPSYVNEPKAHLITDSVKELLNMKTTTNFTVEAKEMYENGLSILEGLKTPNNIALVNRTIAAFKDAVQVEGYLNEGVVDCKQIEMAEYVVSDCYNLIVGMAEEAAEAKADMTNQQIANYVIECAKKAGKDGVYITVIDRNKYKRRKDSERAGLLAELTEEVDSLVQKGILTYTNKKCTKVALA